MGGIARPVGSVHCPAHGCCPQPVPVPPGQTSGDCTIVGRAGCLAVCLPCWGGRPWGTVWGNSLYFPSNFPTRCDSCTPLSEVRGRLFIRTEGCQRAGIWCWGCYGPVGLSLSPWGAAPRNFEGSWGFGGLRDPEPGMLHPSGQLPVH